MKLTKSSSGGTFLNVADVGVKVGDTSSLIITAVEGSRPGRWGERLRVVVHTQDEKLRYWDLAPANKDRLIDLFGAESDDWLDQSISVVLAADSRANTGLRIEVAEDK